MLVGRLETSGPSRWIHLGGRSFKPFAECACRALFPLSPYVQKVRCPHSRSWDHLAQYRLSDRRQVCSSSQRYRQPSIQSGGAGRLVEGKEGPSSEGGHAQRDMDFQHLFHIQRVVPVMAGKLFQYVNMDECVAKGVLPVGGLGSFLKKNDHLTSTIHRK